LESVDQQIDAAGYDPVAHAFPALQGEVVGPFAAIDTSLAPLAQGLSWEVQYTTELIVLSVTGTAGLIGDFNQDGVLDASDIDDLTTQSASGTNPPAYDLNADNLVNETDVDTWIVDLFNSWVGDANLDNEFNSSDLVAVLASGTYEADVASVWSTGDFNGDGRTNSSDLVAALAGGGYEAGPRAAVHAVPEPATAVLLLLPALLLLTRRRAK
jgi:hypothetical protein